MAIIAGECWRDHWDNICWHNTNLQLGGHWQILGIRKFFYFIFILNFLRSSLNFYQDSRNMKLALLLWELLGQRHRQNINSELHLNVEHSNNRMDSIETNIFFLFDGPHLSDKFLKLDTFTDKSEENEADALWFKTTSIIDGRGTKTCSKLIHCV